MSNTKIFRSDLFKHIDGIALIAPLACIFNKNNNLLNNIKSLKLFKINRHDLKKEAINYGCNYYFENMKVKSV